ncbi:MAG: patatin-like phospholipase family protein [Burkholderiaceae bacterium]
MRLPWQAGTPTVNLALQGGGAHGAFTWGVLDALLEDGRLAFDGVSGTSAGAMNAVVLAHGLMTGGREGARQALRTFWTAVAESLPFEIALPAADGQGFRLNPAMRLALQWSHYFAPNQLNPFDVNPLRDILHRQVDFDALRSASPLRLFVATTEARTGRLRLFRTHQVGLEATLASACLPSLHHSVLIDGEPHWDGGYAANPAIYPLLLEGPVRDLMLVLLAPLRHGAMPASAQDIRHRSMELAFNATFLREMRMFGHLRARAQDIPWWRRGPLERRLAGARFHLIEGGQALQQMGEGLQAAAGLRYFEALCALGREHAARWMREHRASLGERSTVDLNGLFG